MARNAGADGSKRKRASAQDKSVKRHKASSEEEEGEDVSSQILLMEQGILESKKNYNDISKLLKTASEFEEGDDEAMLAAVALCRIFVRLLAQGSLTMKKSLSEKDAVVIRWLKDQLSQYKDLLVQLLATDELAGTALTISMRLLKGEGEFMSDKEEYKFPTAFLDMIVEAVLVSENDDVRGMFIQEFAEQFDDVRFYAFKSVKSILDSLDEGQESSDDDVFEGAFELISALDGVPDSAEELEDFYVPKPQKKSHPLLSVTQHKRQGQDAWLALMRRAESKEQRKRILDIVSTVVAPWFTKPELIADFLTNSYDAGGSLSLLALSGVFYLIQHRNLDYPSFYPKLYSLLDRDILHSKHRSRFFRLLDTFLASTHLPAALVASFIKRLSRLALSAPPSAIAFVIPWIYNLLMSHPACTFMVHHVVKSPEAQGKLKNDGFKDLFDPDEPDPMETKAIDSCLWELVQLQSHYHPNVATIAKVLSEQFTKQSYNMEDFLDHSYATLLEAELGKDVRKAPVVEFHIPKRIFLSQDDPATTPDSLLVQMWDFGSQMDATPA